MFGVVCGTNRSVASTWGPYALLGAVALLASCSGETPTDSGEEPVDQEPQFDALTHLISDPVPMPTAAASASASAEDSVSYVSLPPGTYPEGETATITNQANEAKVNATIVDGGFDPVPVPSAVGDTLFITIKNSQGEIIGFERATVPPEAPPLIVRTRPTKNKIIVPLNLVAVVVFSEPIDRLTVTAQTIRVHQGGADGPLVAGTVALQAGGLVAEFVPAAPLEPRTQYTLVVTTGIRDLSGDALADQEVVNFETLGIVAYVAVDGAGCGCTTNGNDYVAVIDTKTHGLIDTPPILAPLWRDILFVPNRPFAYLRSGASPGHIFVLDAATHEVVDVIGVRGQGGSDFMTASEDGRFVYALHPQLGSDIVEGDSGAPTGADSAALREYLPKMFAAANANQNRGDGPRPGPTQCHDITLYPALGLAGGACGGYGLLLDISDPVNPIRIAAVSDSNFSYWHSATFNNDGTKILFTDEWGGGGQPKCRATDPREWGANAIFTVENRQMLFKSYYKLPVAQTPLENCVAHNGSLLPIPGRDVMVQGWYQGGISIFDWTDAANPVEIAFHDRGPMDSTRMRMAGSWSVYWYNGAIVSSEIARGLDIFDLTPSAFLSQNEIDAAKSVKFDYLNAQGQQKFVWPATFVLAGAYLDQLERANGLPAARIASVRQELANAERASGAARREALTTLSTALQGEAGRSRDARRVRLLVSAVRELAGTR